MYSLANKLRQKILNTCHLLIANEKGAQGAFRLSWIPNTWCFSNDRFRFQNSLKSKPNYRPPPILGIPEL